MATAEERRHLEAMDRASILHPNTSLRVHQRQPSLVIERGDGVRVTDANGRSYLDAMAGLWCVNVGYGREELGRAAADEMARLGYFHSFAGASSPPQIRLAERLVGLIREQGGVTGASRVFFGLSGSDANDTQVKLARYYNNLRGRPEKKKIISRHLSYHGLTVASGSLTGIPVFHRAFDLPMDGVLFVSTPHHAGFARPGESEEAYSERLAGELEELIAREGADTIAAFIAEPVMGAGGVFTPPSGYFERIQPILRRHDILFIADEVICGFGRLGKWFGSARYGLQPDTITLAKGLTSGYFPLSAVVISEEIWSVLEAASDEVGFFAHGFTYSGHPVGAAVAMANLDLIEGEGLVENAARVGAHMRERLAKAVGEHPNVSEVRGEGLVMAVQLMQDAAERRPFAPEVGFAGKVAAEAAERGVLVRALAASESVAFSPPLCVSPAEANAMVDGFAEALGAAAARLG